jgi:hypothetical protein
VAKPDNAPDGSLDLMMWKCIIPGKPGVCNFVSLSLSFSCFFFLFKKFYLFFLYQIGVNFNGIHHFFSIHDTRVLILICLYSN